MATLPKINTKLSTLLHGVGLSSLAGALFLQATVFISIARFGYFSGIEQNGLILTSELVLTGIAIAYFIYMISRFVISRI